MKWGIASLAVLALCWSAPVNALGEEGFFPRDRPVFNTRTHDSLAIARAFWATAPPCGFVRTYAAEIGYGAAAADAASCTIWLDHALDFSQARYCLTIVHEVGHLIHGREHSLKPRSIMFAGAGLFIPKGCARRWLRTTDRLRLFWAGFDGFATR